MTDNNHPITPSPKLMRQWLGEFFGCSDNVTCELSDSERYLATQAARWGSDQELEACCEWLNQNTGRWDLLAELRAARRRKPPSLKKQALELIDSNSSYLDDDAINIIRRALEQLND